MPESTRGEDEVLILTVEDSFKIGDRLIVAPDFSVPENWVEERIPLRVLTSNGETRILNAVLGLEHRYFADPSIGIDQRWRVTVSLLSTRKEDLPNGALVIAPRATAGRLGIMPHDYWRLPYLKPDRSPDLEAIVTYLVTSKGGRSKPVSTGYRPNHDFGNGRELLADAQHEYPDKEWIEPGEFARARLWLSAPELHARKLSKGNEFTVQEGGRLVGRGVVSRVFNANLQSTGEPDEPGDS